MFWESLGLTFSCLFLSFLFVAEYTPAQIPPESYVATIYRDRIGVGHVYGDYDPDVAYGVGRLIARDRPLRTLVALTCATGRSALGQQTLPEAGLSLEHIRDSQGSVLTVG